MQNTVIHDIDYAFHLSSQRQPYFELTMCDSAGIIWFCNPWKHEQYEPHTTLLMVHMLFYSFYPLVKTRANNYNNANIIFVSVVMKSQGFFLLFQVKLRLRTRISWESLHTFYHSLWRWIKRNFIYTEIVLI